VNSEELESATASMVTVDRAVGDLRRGDFVVLESAGHVALTQAAETVTAQSLATLTRLANGSASLALTARRASLLELARPAAAPTGASGVVSLPLAGISDAEIIRWLIDPTALRPGRLPQRVTPRRSPTTPGSPR
jgi:GTP cyclohydrolase II